MKIGFLSLGCPKNLVDGEVMLGYTRQAGHEITADPTGADVIVVNTCAFIDAAKEESVEAILEMARLKRDGSCRRLVVTGCLAERYREQLQAEIPEIDAVLGTGEVPDIVSAVEGREPAADTAPTGAVPLTFFRNHAGTSHDAPPTSHNAPRTSHDAPRTSHDARRTTHDAPRTSTEHRAQSTEHVPKEHVPPTYLYDAATPRLLTTPRHYAYVKVAEGCDYTCAFCIIPTLRGRYRSRTEDSVVAEATALAANGVRELLLVSQDTTFFGVDRGERGALARLLGRLDAVDGLEWIRLLYLYPTTVTDDVLDAMADCDKVCRYVDLPLQHASADVLRRMRRPGNRDTYARLLARIRSRVPGVTLRTTFIVGFPGETDEDFAELERFVADTGFDHVGVFTYSHEEDTRAFALPDDVPAGVKMARKHALMDLQRGIVTARHRALIGGTARVMVDGPSPDSDLVLTGRLEGQAPDIDSAVYLSECQPETVRPGQIITVELTDAQGYDLVGRPVA